MLDRQSKVALVLNYRKMFTSYICKIQNTMLPIHMASRRLSVSSTNMPTGAPNADPMKNTIVMLIWVGVTLEDSAAYLNTKKMLKVEAMNEPQHGQGS